jgi:hypothetical protein
MADYRGVAQPYLGEQYRRLHTRSFTFIRHPQLLRIIYIL